MVYRPSIPWCEIYIDIITSTFPGNTLVVEEVPDTLETKLAKLYLSR